MSTKTRSRFFLTRKALTNRLPRSKSEPPDNRTPISKPEVTSAVPRPKKTFKLNEAQINSLRKTWASSKTRGRGEPANSIMRAVFTRFPDLRSVFEANHAQISLKQHGTWLNELMSEVMDKLEDPTTLIPRLRAVGRAHMHLWNYGFRASDFDALFQATLDCSFSWGTERSQRSLEGDAWTALLAFLAENIKEGFYSEKRRSFKRERLNRLSSGRSKIE